MSEGPTTIRCPHCGYPYVMTRLQIDVYVGRSMGCMHCGKSFAVSMPADPPPTDPLLDAGAELVDQQRGATQDAASTGSGSATLSLPPTAPPRQSPKATPSSPLGWVGMAASVLFVVLATVAAVIGYAGSSENAIKAASRSQTPVLLLQIGFGIAVLGVIAGLAGATSNYRRGAGPGGKPRAGLAGTAAIVCLAQVVLASLLALMVMPPLNRGLAESHRAACQTNLQTIGYALIADASARVDGRFPDSLGDLVSRGVIGAETVVCPADQHPPAPSGTSPAGQGSLIDAGKHVSYVYLGKGMAMRETGGRRVSTHTVLAYEPPGLHGDPVSYHLLFADGVVLFVEKAQAEKILAELKSGQNPPPTAEAVKP